MEIITVKIDIPESCIIILDQTHFINTTEDLYEILVTNVPQVKFGIAFTEASGPCLIRKEGNESAISGLCKESRENRGRAHVFLIIGEVYASQFWRGISFK